MKLTDQHIDFIHQDLKHHGVTLEELSDSLLDHICCTIEQDSEPDFLTAYSNAIAAFGKQGLLKVQKETLLLINFKNRTVMKKTMYFLGYIAVALTTTGVLFKIQHWPWASIMITLGIILLNFGFLPMFFYDRYKRALN